MIKILKETARYLVCVKPIGIAAQGTQAEAMPQLLSEQLGCDIFPVHRLDQTVGGIMVYAKTVQEAARLTQAMGQGQMQKTYLAVLTGCPAEKAGTLHLCALVLPAFLPGRKGRSRLRGPAPGPVPVDGVFLIRCTVQSFRQIRTVFSRLTARTSRRAAA